MNLVFGEITEILNRDGQRLGKVRVRGAARLVSLDLLADAAPGDKVVVCEGIAIGKVDAPSS
ncbi:MAG: HypC/HybG/HupF family hydrogenase formation chaperone [Verrucomicrobiota bacterium]